MMGGRFITFEGGEGAGKTTQIKLLAAALRARGNTVTETREPGGAPGAELIRALLLGNAVCDWDPLSEALLHYAARREHLVHTIRPALQRGDFVLCDRFADSTDAYQGFGQGVAREALARLRRLALGDFAPGLTLILDLPPALGLARARQRRNETRSRYDMMDEAIHQRIRDGFLAIARAEPARCIVLDATADVATVAGAVRRTLRERLGINLDG
jgi:dTMP kinase